MALLLEPDIRRIEETVARVEARTDAELVVAVLPRSAPHDEGRFALSLVLTVCTALATFRFVPWGGEAMVLALELPVFIGFFGLLSIPAIHRRLVRPRDAEAAVHAGALRTFAERGVHRTEGRTGILIYVSELERRAVILGDSGVHDVVGEAGWARHVQTLVSRIAEGRAADGIVEVLDALGETLAAARPAAPGRRNELPNRVVSE